ncbi:hypothetical protein SPV_2504 [Streptococcus pneumoniae]|nr:hypothetical protein SPV_2504 [Streptococcus pneumoniae]
MENVSNSM